MTVTKLLRRKITKNQSQDTGMAMVLLLLILYVVMRRDEFIYGAIVVHVLNMTVPLLYRHIAIVWFGLSELIGGVVSKVLLGTIFFALVTPIAVLRRLAGKDSLRLRVFKANGESVMVTRNHKFAAGDLERPY